MTPGSNLIYLFAGYTVFLGGIALYLLSLYVRWRNLERDERTLRQIEEHIQDEEKQGQATPGG